MRIRRRPHIEQIDALLGGRHPRTCAPAPAEASRGGAPCLAKKWWPSPRPGGRCAPPRAACTTADSARLRACSPWDGPETRCQTAAKRNTTANAAVKGAGLPPLQAPPTQHMHKHMSSENADCEAATNGPAALTSSPPDRHVLRHRTLSDDHTRHCSMVNASQYTDRVLERQDVMRRRPSKVGAALVTPERCGGELRVVA